MTGIEVDPAKPASAIIRIHAYRDERHQAVEAKLQSPFVAGQQTESTEFMPLGATNWMYSGAEEINDISDADKIEIFEIVASYVSAFRKHDITEVLSFNKVGTDIAAKLLGMSSAEAETENRQSLSDAFRNLPKFEAEGVDRLQIIRFGRGAVVIAKDCNPFVRLSSPEKPQGSGLVIRSLVFCKMKSKWVIIK